MQVINTMANMSAEILRNIVASVLKVNPRIVKLNGEININFIPQDDCGHSWWSGASEHHDNLYGFSTTEGLKPLDIKCNYNYSQNGDCYHTEGESILQYLERTNTIEKYIFFVNVYNGKEYGETGERYEGVTLYKAANFKAALDNLTNEDIARWEQWLNE